MVVLLRLWKLGRDSSLRVVVRRAEVTRRGAQSRVGKARRATAVAVWSTRGGFCERKEKCKLFNHKCPKCGRLGHSEKYCHGPASQCTATTTEKAKAPVSYDAARRWALCQRQLASSAA